MAKAKKSSGTKKTAKKPTVAKKRKAVAKRTGSVASLWRQIEELLAAKRRGEDMMLRPPATEAQIAAAERALGVDFPEDFRESLRIHDGQDDSCQVMWLPIAQRLGSLASLVQCWKDDRTYYEPDAEDHVSEDGTVRTVHQHPKHIPIAGSAYWDYDRLMLDFAPGPKGQVGQVIARNDIDIELVAPTFRDLLAQVAEQLASE